ncbi:hypothetical protein [Streptomyces sp. NPDC057580]|uniref:hypothetical protein n=1 Tax=Streptomyces sp. NPDC057580 TaxID=3346173 RepID=UPI00369045CF
MYGCVAMVSLGIGAGLSGNSKTDAPQYQGRTDSHRGRHRDGRGAGADGHRHEDRHRDRAPKAAQVAATVPGDGTYLVGGDMKSGTYKTKGPADGSFGCYWERAMDSSGEFTSITANDNLNGSGLVTVRKGETFKSSGCQDWVKVG